MRPTFRSWKSSGCERKSAGGPTRSRTFCESVTYGQHERAALRAHRDWIEIKGTIVAIIPAMFAYLRLFITHIYTYLRLFALICAYLRLFRKKFYSLGSRRRAPRGKVLTARNNTIFLGLKSMKFYGISRGIPGENKDTKQNLVAVRHGFN